MERLTELRQLELLEAEKEQQLLDLEFEASCKNHRQNLLNLRSIDANEGDKNNFVQTYAIN